MGNSILMLVMFRSALLLLALTVAVYAANTFADTDGVLLTTPQVTVTQRDYDAELSRLSPELRSGFGANPKRVSDLLYTIIVNKTLAAQAIRDGLDKDREVREQIAAETTRILARRRLSEIEEAAGREFDAKGDLTSAARERYLIESEKFRRPEEVAVSHILFQANGRSEDDARRLALNAREKAVAGADFNVLAAQLSEDPSAKSNGGRLGYFPISGKMDAAFSKAAFSLNHIGDISEPVKTTFGWHIIRLDARKAAGLRPFDEVKDEILKAMRRQYIQNQQNVLVAAIRNDSAITVNRPAVDGLIRALPLLDRNITER